MSRVDSLPSKAVNQYRSRDIFAYLSLRYHVLNQAAQHNDWAERNASHVVLGSAQGSYLRSLHFKQLNEDGSVEYRELFIPGPNESLSEAALISYCADFWDDYATKSVFSYIPTKRTDPRAYFQPYIEGLRSRQEEISTACREHPFGAVLYIDIKKFYPSISLTLARTAWKDFCNTTNIDSSYRELGFKLIYNYGLRSNGKHILTGPMFCHFLANLVLVPIDRWAKQLPVTYLRYVDDMTFVGSQADVADAAHKLSDKLEELGLSLHDLKSPKTLMVSTQEWQESAGDFRQGKHAISWMRLVGDIKKLILFKSDVASELTDTLQSEGFRIPVLDYALAAREVSSFQRVRELGLWNWLRIKMRRVTIKTVLERASALSTELSLETKNILICDHNENAFNRKRLISKLRYRLGRLIYIGKREDLEEISHLLESWPDLTFHSEIIKAILSRDCSRVVSLGINVSQAAAQVFRSNLETAVFSEPVYSEAEIQGLSAFLLNGVPVEGSVRAPDHPLLRLARGPIDDDLMRQPRGLIQEIACLHGRGVARHAEIMGSAFDLDQDILLDALEFDYGYYL